MKSGTTATGQRAASSHTAALAGSEAAVDALFHQAGVIRAASLEELIDVAALLSSQPEPRGRRVARAHERGRARDPLRRRLRGGRASSFRSRARARRDRLATLLSPEASLANPIDMLGRRNARHLRGSAPGTARGPARRCGHRALRADGDRDGARRSRRRSSARLGRRATSESRCSPSSCRRPASPSRFDAPSRASPPSRTPSPPRGRSAAPRSARTGCAARTAPSRRSRASTTRPPRRVVRDALAGQDDGWLDARRDARAAAGLRPPARPRAYSPPLAEEAVAAARELGFPVVVKTAVAGAHKTEVGGVALDLADESAVREAAERIGGAGHRSADDPRRRRAPGRRRPGPGLRATRRLRARRRPRGAHRRGGVPHRAADGRRCRGARHVREGRSAGAGLPGRARGGRRSARRSRASGSPASARSCPRSRSSTSTPCSALPDRCVVVDARVRVQRRERVERAKSW